VEIGRRVGGLFGLFLFDGGRRHEKIKTISGPP